jgi:hypothetical protein
MAERDDKPSDVEKLLAEVEGTLSGKPAARSAGPVEPASGGFATRVRRATLSAATAFAIVWVFFALLPFLRATSGAVGAFLATFVVVLLLPRR